jgi:oxygen-independent coproporphyrinogen-3 oxidase
MHWQNHTELGEWEGAIGARRLPVERGFTLDEDDRARAALINRLMCDGQVDLSRLGREYELDPDVYFARELATLGKLDELASYDRATHTVLTTELGRLLVRNVCMVFDRYHHEQEIQRYSSTI